MSRFTGGILNVSADDRLGAASKRDRTQWAARAANLAAAFSQRAKCFAYCQQHNRYQPHLGGTISRRLSAAASNLLRTGIGVLTLIGPPTRLPAQQRSAAGRRT